MRTVKSCPFCGSEATIVYDEGLTDIPDGYCVECEECKTSGNHFDNADAAVEWWNRRVIDTDDNVKRGGAK